MKAQEFVKSLFKDYEETPALRDFMEEIQSNLEDRTASLVKKGLSEDEAFAKASAELGDVGALADEMSLKRRQEVYEDAYLGIQRYMNPSRVAAYVVFGSLLVFGVISALVVYFSHFALMKNLMMTTATLLPFFVASVAGFTFLGLTQETAAVYPMPKKRAAWYSLAAGLISFGLILFPLVYFTVSREPFSFVEKWGLVPALASEIPFLIPGIGLLVYLCLTEKPRLKPWAMQNAAGYAAYLNCDPANMIRFGLFSGAIWIFAIGVFVALGFIIGFKFSWLVFVFATAGQLLAQALLYKPDELQVKSEK